MTTMTSRYAFAAGACLALGILFFFCYNQYIIFNFSKGFAKENKHLQLLKKKTSLATLHYWINNKWHKENSTVLVSEDAADMSKQLISQLLDIFDQEKIIDKQITLQHVISMGVGHLLVSFDRNPLSKNKNSYEKLMLIESILKTIRENNIKISDITFCAHYKPLNDAELDFSNPWPIYGFTDTL
ncbi:hypothetical protein Noda2021_01190 [Candidatus Dependentiae bacterium Noda2021]|nr:hypothetical protein Noda2021_01190 [Candidatus Dependentiae bacterium Noda2021]